MNKKTYIVIQYVLIALIVCLAVASVYVIKLCVDLVSEEAVPQMKENIEVQNAVGDTSFFESSESTETTVPEPETTAPEPEHVISTATIGSMGDLLMHEPIFSCEGKYNAAVQQADGSYDFESVFRYLSSYTTALDYAVVNLETTLADTSNGYPYNGYPLFNCPDEIVDGTKAAGFDMLLTANNHSYDTSLVGYKRTIQVIRDKGLENLGTYLSENESKWTIVDINGINIGMLCYTYATSVTEDGRPSLNFNAAISEEGICNYFTYNNLDAFYEEVEKHLDEMKSAGAEATMLYIHWGSEYQLVQNSQQESIAQALCNLGIDVIIGGHPHVVQPIALLESSTDPSHKTVCLYSMGNAVSNQRLGNLTAITTAHTEDGLLFNVTFEKYSDGMVYLADVDVIPTWVNRHNNINGRTEYNILPLDYDRIDEWGEMFEIEETTLNAAKKSFSRTMDILGSGLEYVQEYLQNDKADRETYYLEMFSSASK